MSPAPRNRIALLFALPALLVPIIEIPLVMWARFAFIERNPSYMNDPPTISRSINDPAVGGLFANLILVITGLILLAMPVIVWAYATAISRLELSLVKRRVLLAVLASVFVFQVIASTGMVMTTQFTFAIDHDLHMLGSYLFFCFQALTILIAASLCRILLRLQREQGIDVRHWQFLPVMHRFRFGFALVIVGMVIAYGILFVAKDHALPVSRYVVQVAYTQLEVIVIGCYVLFLGTYGIDILHMARHGKLRLGAPPDAAARDTAEPDAR